MTFTKMSIGGLNLEAVNGWKWDKYSLTIDFIGDLEDRRQLTFTGAEAVRLEKILARVCIFDSTEESNK